MPTLSLFNSLTRATEPFAPLNAHEVRVYTCGPTVYNYQHIGNMRAFLFADTLVRTLRWKGYPVRHVVNITDVGHLTSDADVGDDKMEVAAAREGRSIWDIAAHYTQAFKRDVQRLNIAEPTLWSLATDHIHDMIAFAERIPKHHCYLLPDGLYFDVSTVPDYATLFGGDRGREEFKAAFEAIATNQTPADVALAADRAKAGAASASRIVPVAGKRQPQDFAIWRLSAPGERRQMEWPSPWGPGAPGWHLECSVMSRKHLGLPFDIHTGGIDHREIHHPNEIAQNKAFCGCASETSFTGAQIWMHNNFLIERSGKMSKSRGEFLTLQALVDRGFHPLAYRLMCLQAHYRSEMEFSWDGLEAAAARLNRIAKAIELTRTSAKPFYSYMRSKFNDSTGTFSARKVEQNGSADMKRYLAEFDNAISDDLNTVKAIPVLETALKDKRLHAAERKVLSELFARPLGLDLRHFSRRILRHGKRSPFAKLSSSEVQNLVAARRLLKARGFFEAADAVRGMLTENGVEVMDGDPLGWDWRVG